jgi:membrane protein insertase Oxa1/YidC/SpoIIIJ
MFAWMPWIFLVMLATFPAGLVIYWTWNNVLSILQQYVLMRRMNVPVEFFENVKTPEWMKSLVARLRSGRTPAEPGKVQLTGEDQTEKQEGQDGSRDPQKPRQKTDQRIDAE